MLTASAGSHLTAPEGPSLSPQAGNSGDRVRGALLPPGSCPEPWESPPEGEGPCLSQQAGGQVFSHRCLSFYGGESCSLRGAVTWPPNSLPELCGRVHSPSPSRPNTPPDPQPDCPSSPGISPERPGIPRSLPGSQPSLCPQGEHPQ